MRKLLGICLMVCGMLLLVGYVVDLDFGIFGKRIQREEVSLSGVGLIHLDIPYGNLQIKATDDNHLSFSHEGRGQLQVQKRGDRLEVEIRGSWLQWPFRGGELELSLPRSYQQDLLVDMSGGNVELHAPGQPFRLNQVELSLSHGNIELYNLQAKTLSQDVSAGNVYGENLVVQQASFDVSTGNVELKNFSGQFAADISHGNLDAQVAELSGPIAVEVSVGDITLDLPDETAVFLNTHAGVGNVTNQLGQHAGQASAGGYPVTLEVSVGNIHVH